MHTLRCCDCIYDVQCCSDNQLLYTHYIHTYTHTEKYAPAYYMVQSRLFAVQFWLPIDELTPSQHQEEQQRVIRIYSRAANEWRWMTMREKWLVSELFRSKVDIIVEWNMRKANVSFSLSKWFFKLYTRALSLSLSSVLFATVPQCSEMRIGRRDRLRRIRKLAYN